MPWGDGTGPMGRGPMTGRRAGYCSGFPGPGYANPYVPRMGMGWGNRFGWGRGFGWRRGWWWRDTYYPYYYSEPSYYRPLLQTPATTQNADAERTYLENLLKDLEEEMNNIKKRLNELSGENKQ